MNSRLLILSMVMFINCAFSVFAAEDINLKLEMPSHHFSAGMTCSVDLDIQNNGLARNNSELFVALTLGTGDYWFYPSWCQFPDEVDYKTISIESFSQNTAKILPEFEWPEAGAFSGALFLAAVVEEGELISNLAEFEFNWMEAPCLETIAPSSGAPGSKLELQGMGFDLEAERIKVLFGDFDIPIISKRVNADGMQSLVSVIPPLESGDYGVKVEFNGRFSNAVYLHIEELASTGKPLGQVMSELNNGMEVITSTFRDNLIPDAVAEGIIESQDLSKYQNAIDRGNLIFGAFYDNFQTLDQENQELLESIMVQNGVDQIFSELVNTLNTYDTAGPLDVYASNLMITLDLTSACLSALDTAWTAIDIATLAAAVLSGGTFLPAPVVSVGTHLTIKVVDHVIDGGLPTDLTHVYIETIPPHTTIPFRVNETKEFILMGTFESQETIIEATLNMIIETCLAQIGEWLPDTVMNQIIELILDVLSHLGLEGWMSFLGDEFMSIFSIPPFELPLDFNNYDNPLDLETMLGRTMFQGCIGPMASLLNSLGCFVCDSGIRTPNDICVLWDINYEELGLTAGDHSMCQVYPVPVYLRWFAYRPFTLGLEVPTSDIENYQVRYNIDISDSPNPTFTTMPTNTPSVATPTPPPPTHTPAAPTYTPAPPTNTPTSEPETPTPTPSPIPTNFVYIPSGTFQMGSPSNEMCRDDDEGPVHSVTITQGFYMQQTEVTQQQWVNIFGTNPSYTIGMNYPVDVVTWYDACIYCNRMSLADGLLPCYYTDESYTVPFDGTPPVHSGSVYWNQGANGYRLPTEAEWEYACRAGTNSPYNNGMENLTCNYYDWNLDPLAWFSWNSAGPQDIGMKQSNSWELYDMHGNGYEWCWDKYSSVYYGMSPSIDPVGPSLGHVRVFRGGSWDTDAEYCRSANRLSGYPEYHYLSGGLRLVHY